jgi:hypothetical protein
LILKHLMPSDYAACSVDESVYATGICFGWKQSVEPFLSGDICLYLATPQGVLLQQPIYLGLQPQKRWDAMSILSININHATLVDVSITCIAGDAAAHSVVSETEPAGGELGPWPPHAEIFYKTPPRYYVVLPSKLTCMALSMAVHIYQAA